MIPQPYIPDALPLNNLDYRLLLPLVGQANAALARYNSLLLRSRQGTLLMLEVSETPTKEFVESGLCFGLHKSISGVCGLHKKWGVA